MEPSTYAAWGAFVLTSGVVMAFLRDFAAHIVAGHRTGLPSGRFVWLVPASAIAAFALAMWPFFAAARLDLPRDPSVLNVLLTCGAAAFLAVLVSFALSTVLGEMAHQDDDTRVVSFVHTAAQLTGWAGLIGSAYVYLMLSESFRDLWF